MLIRCYGENSHMPANDFEPLAARMRPRSLEEFAGQPHLLGEGRPLRAAVEQGRLHSMILWGPPGTGKTTLARLIAAKANAEVEAISAVLSGVKEIRLALEKAEKRLAENIPTVLFVDEVHRFNKAQQDAFLPYVENGTVTFIGATTENPSFALNNALLSRARVYVLKALTESDLLLVIQRALPNIEVSFPEELHPLLVKASDGDARRCLNLLELAAELAKSEAGVIDQAILEALFTGEIRRFDKQGEEFYDQISALHKAVRGSSPDAALYWLTRMLDGGCDPQYLLRRIIRMASEDIGNADPRALDLALAAWESYERLGSPEGELAIAQAIIYMAIAAKSNAVYTAFGKARADVEAYGSLPVPLHLRNAPTHLMKQLDYGKHYRYAHDEPHGYAAGENYWPEGFAGRQYYFPTDRGLEQKIREKLDFLKGLDKLKGS